MLKIWCEKCEATGITYLNSSDELCEINGEDCLNCQGKGYVELEPEYFGTERELWSLGIDTLFDVCCDSKKIIYVYFKVE